MAAITINVIEKILGKITLLCFLDLKQLFPIRIFLPIMCYSNSVCFIEFSKYTLRYKILPLKDPHLFPQNKPTNPV